MIQAFRPQRRPRPPLAGRVATLKKPRQFDRVFKHGKCQSRELLALHVVRSNHRGLRLGICVSSKVGGAVVRNRIRRQLREVARSHRHEMLLGFDCIVMVRASAAGASLQKLDASFYELGKRVGILAPPERSRQERSRQVD